jgi:hypothetical protein
MKMTVQMTPAGIFVKAGLLGLLDKEGASTGQRHEKLGLLQGSRRINYFLNFNRADSRDARKIGVSLKHLRKQQSGLIFASLFCAVSALAARLKIVNLSESIGKELV